MNKKKEERKRKRKRFPENKEHKRRKLELENKYTQVVVPVPMLSLHESTALKCFAAFFTLSPLALKNLSTHASLQNFSYC